MTGRPSPKYKTDDIRASLRGLTNSRAVATIVEATVVVSFLALLLQFTVLDPGVRLATDRVLSICLAILTVDISLKIIANRFEYFSSPGNLLAFLTVGVALFTPFRVVLLLRLYPLVRKGAFGVTPPPRLSAWLVVCWLVLCLTAATATYAQYKGLGCGAWVDCTFGAFRDTWT